MADSDTNRLQGSAQYTLTDLSLPHGLVKRVALGNIHCDLELLACSDPDSKDSRAIEFTLPSLGTNHWKNTATALVCINLAPLNSDFVKRVKFEYSGYRQSATVRVNFPVPRLPADEADDQKQQFALTASIQLLASQDLKWQYTSFTGQAPSPQYKTTWRVERENAHQTPLSHLIGNMFYVWYDRKSVHLILCALPRNKAELNIDWTLYVKELDMTFRQSDVVSFDREHPSISLPDTQHPQYTLEMTLDVLPNEIDDTDVGYLLICGYLREKQGSSADLLSGVRLSIRHFLDDTVPSNLSGSAEWTITDPKAMDFILKASSPDISFNSSRLTLGEGIQCVLRLNPSDGKLRILFLIANRNLDSVSYDERNLRLLDGDLAFYEFLKTHLVHSAEIIHVILSFIDFAYGTIFRWPLTAPTLAHRVVYNLQHKELELQSDLAICTVGSKSWCLRISPVKGLVFQTWGLPSTWQSKDVYMLFKIEAKPLGKHFNAFSRAGHWGGEQSIHSAAPFFRHVMASQAANICLDVTVNILRVVEHRKKSDVGHFGGRENFDIEWQREIAHGVQGQYGLQWTVQNDGNSMETQYSKMTDDDLFYFEFSDQPNRGRGVVMNLCGLPQNSDRLKVQWAVAVKGSNSLRKDEAAMQTAWLSYEDNKSPPFIVSDYQDENELTLEIFVEVLETHYIYHGQRLRTSSL